MERYATDTLITTKGKGSANRSKNRDRQAYCIGDHSFRPDANKTPLKLNLECVAPRDNSNQCTVWTCRLNTPNGTVITILGYKQCGSRGMYEFFGTSGKYLNNMGLVPLGSTQPAVRQARSQESSRPEALAYRDESSKEHTGPDSIVRTAEQDLVEPDVRQETPVRKRKASEMEYDVDVEDDGKDRSMIVVSTSDTRDYTKELLAMFEAGIEDGAWTKTGNPPANMRTLDPRKWGKRALRAVHIRKDRRWNGAVQENMEAALIQMIGVEVFGKYRCEKCQEGRGIYRECVFVTVIHGGACGCCVMNKSASRYSFRQHGGITQSGAGYGSPSQYQAPVADMIGQTTFVDLTRDQPSATSESEIWKDLLRGSPAPESHTEGVGGSQRDGTPEESARSVAETVARATHGNLDAKAPHTVQDTENNDHGRPYSPVEASGPKTEASNNPRQMAVLTAEEKALIILLLSIRGDSSGEVEVDFDECNDLEDFVIKIVNGPFHDVIPDREAIRGVKLRVTSGPDARATWLTLSSPAMYRRFLQQIQEESRLKAGGTVTVTAEIELRA